MLKIIKEHQSGNVAGDLSYIEGRGALGRIVMRLTRWLRARHAGRYLTPARRHLDIGCGDGYFLRRSPCEERFGLDKSMGDEVSDHLDFPDAYFNCVTMLAVIEHISHPRPLLEEIHRVLSPGGRLIITTPKQAAEALIALYARDIGDEHETYYTAQSLADLTDGLFEVEAHHTFLFGLNQVFCLTRL